MNKEQKELEKLAGCMTLGALLERVWNNHGGYELLAHWKQGEFHHDVVIEMETPADLWGSVLVVSTNCNGGVKEVLCFERAPQRWALWKYRCPENQEFEGQIPKVLGQARTPHWFHPCEILLPDARSELKPEFRRRQRGGGWRSIHDPED